MKKTFILIPLLMLSFSAVAHAAPAQPEASVWIVPSNAKKGDKAEIDALVYNSTIKTVSVSILFATPDDDVATIALTLPAGTAKTATSEWVVPDGQTTVTASVIKAVDASQKNVPELLGPIGSVTVGKAPGSTITVAGFGIGAKTWFGSLIAAVEPWRMQQADRFAKLRDQKRSELGYYQAADGTSRYEPRDVPGAYSSTPASDAASQELAFGKYATLWYSSALATIFASATIFYVCVGLLILILFRLFIKLFT